jgi:hypothetical protein
MLSGPAGVADGTAAAGSADGLMPVTPSVGRRSAASNETPTMPEQLALKGM